MRVGIDLVEIKRIRLDENFMSKIADETEIAHILSYKQEKSQRESLAGLWAVKEAVFKLLGLGKDSGVVFKDVLLCHEKGGRPFVKLLGLAEQTYLALGLEEIEISISHTDDYATAVAIAK